MKTVLIRPRVRAMPASRRHRRESGAVLIIALLIVIVLTGMTIVFARSMRVEALATANQLAQAEARAIALGAAQAVLALGDELPADAVEVGNGAFWLIQPSFEDDRTPTYGIVDESAKVNLNSASEEMLYALPGMDELIVAAIIDWRDEDNEPSANGAEDEYYLMLSDPYYAKNEPFETVEELLLVRGVTAIELYGEDKNRNGIIDDNENDAAASEPPDNRDGRLDRGLIDFVTVYSGASSESRINVNGSSGGGGNAPGGGGNAPGGGGNAPGGAGGGQETGSSDEELRNVLQEAARDGLLQENRVDTIFGNIVAGRTHRNMLDLFYKSGMTVEEFDAVDAKLTTGNEQAGLINVNSAPKEVLMALPGLEETDAEALVSHRLGMEDDGDPETEPSVAWVSEVLEPEKAIAIGSMITANADQRSVDIVAVSGDGRAFERYRMVFGGSGQQASILLWQRLTHLGWPLDPEILTKLREGTAVSELARTTNRGSF